ncbi:LytS/YhcK type 5TM receptor domain-containing protein [uncultured Tateyamaria sp.]|uniref:LytS/YhcK type 5TM receptor domain-containing protein n=1 Tax=uncultured Tateyamaria sp. TaxID=455651 RepID=UPI002631A898|nr:LytS/YhcK type 5TM receptor domain-containing protein [uncultured Tateyamaria sp.]
MTFVGVPVLLDFVSSLAVLGLLVVGFSALAPSLTYKWFSAPLLGVFFALVVGLQMSMPLSPTDGVIIDMRNVPIVLAGAFLGLRGLLICLVISIAFRAGLGGVGTMPGIIGMLIAGGVGYAWSLAQPLLKFGDIGKLGVLGLLVNLHMLSAFTAPPQIVEWYFAQAAPTIFVLNMICVPALGWLMMRTQYLVAHQAQLAASAHVDPITRLLTTNAFAREVAHFHSADAQRRVQGMVALTLKNAAWLDKTWGETATVQALGALRVRLSEMFHDNRPLGADGQQRVLIPVTVSEMQDLRPLRHALRRLASDMPFSLDGDVEVPLSVLVETVSFRNPDNPDETLKDIRRSASVRRSGGARQGPAPRPAGRDIDMSTPAGVCSATLRRLFDETDAQLQRVARQS